MKRLLLIMVIAVLGGKVVAEESFKSNIVAEEGAWCWFADPRALHYENEAGTINASYLGYIDVHGNVMATQYDWLTKRKTDVLIRSYFQPDDHNNPTFVILPDERVMIFYTRHTDEAKIWYRISRKPGDITALGEEKYLTTANNTTYPSPFILSDDPQHIYLCWRGINWHPTLARLTMPDGDDNCQFDFGPKQIVQSTGARPYAKYQSNGKDKIYLAYTTGHPDNEQPDWLYFNVIDINKGNGPILRDINGNQLKKISDGVFNVNKQSSYASSYPATIVDNTSNIRNWVWQIALDKDEHPVIAYPHIDDAKMTHVYWYARWTGSEWRRTWVQYAGHAFHQNWDKTERCYSGGMTLDPDNINDMYLSIPTKNGQYNKDGVYEIWKYTIDDDGRVAGSEQITMDSEKNNVRPFILPGSKNSPMRLGWMQGDYYYWMVNKNYPKGYPTKMMCNYEWTEDATPGPGDDFPYPDCYCFGPNTTAFLGFYLNQDKYEGALFTIGENFTYRINSTTKRPEVVINGTTYTSQNALYTSDNWANASSGTNGDNHPTKLKKLIIALSYDGQRLVTYRNGLVDQVIELEGWNGETIDTWETNHSLGYISISYVCLSPMEIRAQVKNMKFTNPNLPTELQNGDFEGTYSVQEGSGVSSDRAIYVPEGWTVERSNGNENDLTALKEGDLYFSNFFGSLAKPSADSKQTYWIRQNWGTPTLTLSQEIRLPKGQYTLTCDLWKSGLGGDAIVYVIHEDGTSVNSPTLENKTEWQQISLDFDSDGQSSTTIQLTAMHNSNGSEKIIGFDNVVLTKKEENIDGSEAQINGIYYKFSGDEATVTYQQYQQEYQDEKLIENYISDYTGDIVIPETVEHDGRTYRVTTIGDHAFFGCSDVTSISIPESVDSIGNYALRHCYGLTSLNIPESVGFIGNCAIADCVNLTSVNIPAKMKTLSMGLFIRDAGLTSITIPEDVDSIGSWVFYGCSNLTSVDIPKGVKSLECSVFENCTNLTSVTLPKGLTYIDKHAFSLCTSLPSIVIPEGVTSIGRAAFQGCTNLASVVLPESLVNIGSLAFLHCESLTSVVIPEGVTQIGSDAFQMCTSMTSITLPESLTTIDERTFLGCESLTDIVLPKNLTTIKWGAFSACVSLKTITIPESVTQLGSMVFEVCFGLESIIVEEGNKVYDSRGNCNAIIETATNTLLRGCQNTVIPEDVTTINFGAFFKCYPLTSIVIPEGVTSMYDGAFQESGLTSVSIPSTMKYIDICVFQGCTNLTNVYCHAENIPETKETTFEGVPFATATLHVPAESIGLYKATEPWSNFGNIVPLETPVKDVLHDEPSAYSLRYYNLQGHFSDQPAQRGVYIYNGKKIIVK